MLATHLCLVPRLRTSRAETLLPVYASMAVTRNLYVRYLHVEFHIQKTNIFDLVFRLIQMMAIWVFTQTSKSFLPTFRSNTLHHRQCGCCTSPSVGHAADSHCSNCHLTSAMYRPYLHFSLMQQTSLQPSHITDIFLTPVTSTYTSAVGIATCYGLDGPWIESWWGARYSAPVQSGPGAHPATCTMGTGSLPGVKRPGRGDDHPPPSSTKFQGRVQLYLYSTCEPLWPVLGWTLLYCTLESGSVNLKMEAPCSFEKSGKPL